jgi:PAS domain S-box-containing protein
MRGKTTAPEFARGYGEAGDVLALAAGVVATSDSQRLAAIVESSLDAIIGLDLAGCVTSWNAAATTLFGYSAESMLGGPVARLIPPEAIAAESALVEKLRRGERVDPIETRRRTRDGRVIGVSVAISPLRDCDGRLVGTSHIVRTATTPGPDERELSRLTRLYAGLRQVNQAIAGTTTREALFRQVCRLLVEHAGLRMAWIGWNEPESHRLVPMAGFGDTDGYVAGIRVFTDDRPEGRGPAGTAFRSGAPYISNDLARDPAAAPWHAQLADRGLLSCAAFPIRFQGAVSGTLSVYADRRDFFQAQALALLEDAAADISFALDNFAREQARASAEQDLRVERAFFDAMLESLPGIVYVYDEAGRFLRWNRNFETVTGFTAQDIAHMHPLDFFGKDDQQRVEERIAQVFQGGDAAVEAALLTRDGAAIPHYFTGRRVEFRNTRCLVGVGLDISSRKRAEGALHDAVTRFRTLFEQAPVGVVLLDAQSASIVECNDQAARQLGYTVKELTGLPIAAIEVVESPQEIRHRIDRLLEQGPAEFDTLHRTRTGAIINVHVSCRTIELGGQRMLDCVFLDVTERQRAQARIRESEAHLLEAQRIAGIGSWAMDLKTERLHWSEQNCAIFGVVREDAAADFAQFLAYVHPDDRERLLAEHAAVLQGLRRLDMVHRIVLRDGTEKVVHEVADLKRDAEGRPNMLYGTIHDISARVRIEAEREKRLRAETADRIKSDFLATMSHELRTPLNSIIGFTGILLQAMAGPLNAEQNKQLGMVRASARHLLALVNDVLDISKIEAQQLTVDRAPFDLRFSIDKTTRIIEAQCRAKGLALDIALPDSPGMALGDARRFEQILLNLLSNAVKFTAQGAIRLRVEWFDASGAPAAAPHGAATRVCLNVGDTGIGIRPQDLASLFQPFRQIDTGLTRNYEGTGLGLAISQRLAHLMGGDIHVESHWGKGSTFSLTMPLPAPAGTVP